MKTKIRNAHIYRRIISLILTVVLLFLAIPQTIFAEIRSAVEENDTQAPASDAANSVKDSYSYNVSGDVYELEERREASVKHFRTEDGSIVAAQYPTDVHILDGNGKWQDIDNTLSDFGSEYGTGNTGIKFAKKITGNESLFAIHDGNGKLTMSLDGAIKKTAGKIVTSTAEDGDGTKLGKLMTLENFSSRIIYENILNGVDLEYITEGRNVKENIIVKEQLDSYSFTFTLKLNNLEAELLPDGSVRVFDGDGETVFSIPAPITYDAAGNYAPTESTYFTLEVTKNGNYALTVTQDATWMNAEDRAFPVTIDPTLNSTASNIVDTYISSANSSTSYSSGSYCYVSANSNERISYWKTTSIPNIPSSAYITEATLSLYALYASLSFDVGIYNVTSDWDSTLTWSAYSAGTAGAVATSMCDYVRISAGSDDKWYTWDITDIVEDWYSGTANYGVCLKQANTVSSYVYFASANYSIASCSPVFSVTYRDIKGIESYYSYLSQDLGLAGTGYVNIATGKMTLINGTLTTTDSLFGFTPTLVYNSSLAGKTYSHENAEVPYSSTETKTPYGFKWNFQETIIEKTYINSEGTTATCYVLADADGTEHAFFYSSETEDGVKIYHDEDSLQLKMYINTSEIVIKDLNKTERHYTKATFSDYGAAAWYLTSIVDAPGNKLDFVWRTGTYLPSSIRVTPKGNSTITMLNFLYTSGNIPYAVYNSSSEDAVILRYSETPRGDISVSAWQYLRSITWVKYTSTAYLTAYYNNSTATTGITLLGSASYVYQDPYATIFSAIDDLTGRKINYGLQVSKMNINSIMEYSADSTRGQTVNLTYMPTPSYTRVQTSGSDDTINTSDDIYTFYNIDNCGRVINSYTTDRNKNKLYGATYGEYDTQENAKNNIKHSFSVDGSSVNLLLNGGFADRTTSAYPYWTVSGAVNITADGPQFVSTTAATERSVSQTVTIPAGTYTLSADINTYGTVGADITLIAVSSDGTYNFEKAIPSDEYNVSSGINRFSLTFTTTSEKTFDISVSVSFTGSEDYQSVIFCGIALEKNVGIGEHTMIEMGGFDCLTSGAVITDYWQNDTNDFSVTSSSKLFGNTATVAGDINKEKYVKQTVIELPYDAYSYGGYRFFVSGFGKAAQAIINDRAKFAIRVDVYYYTNGGSGEDDLETHRFEFNENNTDWQFVSGTFVTREYESIHKIEVICEYAYQPYGVAYFDNIAFYEMNKSFTEYEYYPNGLVYLCKNMFDTVTYEYDEEGQTTRIANNNGELTDYTYDTYGNLVKEIDYTFVNGTVNKFYPLCPKDTEGNYTFDSFNPDLQITKTPKYRTDYSYNAYGQNINTISYPAVASGTSVVQKTGAKKIVSTYEYQTASVSRIFGALLSERDSSGREVRYYYDSTNGNLLASINVTDGNGTAYTYDNLGNLVTVMPATYTSDSAYSTVTNAENVAYTYDEHNRLSTVVTDSTTYTFAYDSFGNSSSIGVGTNTLASYEYNSYNGKLKKLNYGNGVSVEYVYDDLDNVKEIWYTENEGNPTLAYSYTYTAKGQLHSLEDHLNDKTTVYEYDRNGRVVAMAEYDSESLVNVFGSTVYYNSTTGLVSGAYYNLAYTKGTESYDTSWDYSYSYNADRTLKKVNVYNPVADGSISYTYDDYYRLSTKVYDFDLDSDSSKEFVNTTTYTYKNYGTNAEYTGIEVDSFTTQVNSNTAVTYTYTYDNKGNIIKIVGTDGSEYRYVYDDLGQLIREDNTETGETYVYTYDSVGNITSNTVYNIVPVGETPTDPKNAYTYSYNDTSWGDKLTSYRDVNFTYDEIGNPLTYYNGTSYNFTWVQGRRLETATKSGQTYTYTYNADGIRTSKNVWGITIEYILNGSQIIGEKWSNGTTIVYIYDAEASPIGMLYRDASYAQGEFDVYWYEKNLFGDVIAVYDSDGTKLVSYTYDAWGSCSEYSADTVPLTIARNPFRYRSYYYDVETGFYYLNSRYYDPEIGRFISADGYVSTGQGLTGYNMYAYCGNNPVMRVDANGEWWFVKLFVAVVAVVVVVVVIVAEVVSPSKEEHYARNDNNKIPSEDELCEIVKGEHEYWKPVDDVLNKYHRFENGTQGEEARFNRKYMSEDGHYEVIICYSKDAGVGPYIVTASNNIGTYNYGDNYIEHFLKDVYPYWKYGNSPDDSTTFFGRVFGN